MPSERVPDGSSVRDSRFEIGAMLSTRSRLLYTHLRNVCRNLKVKMMHFRRKVAG